VNCCVLVYENNFVMMSGEDKKDLASVKAHSRAKRSRTLLNLKQKLNTMQCCKKIDSFSHRNPLIYMEEYL
jgi:hypothetical protein